MAKSTTKKNNLKMRGYRTHRYLRYRLQHTVDGGGSGEDNHYIDLGRDLSALNRRLYKQGMIYNISNIAIHDNQSAIAMEFGTLRDAWPTYSAYRQARRIWKRQHHGSGMPVGAWSQFVVGMNRDQVTDTDTLIPIDQEQTTVVRGEWPLSCLSYHLDLSSQNEDDAGLVMLGESNTATPTQAGSVNSGTNSAWSGCAYVINSGQGDSVSLAKQTFSGTLGIMAEYGSLKQDVSETPNETQNNSSVFAKLDQMASGFSGHVNDNPQIIERTDKHGDHPPYAQDIVGLEATGSDAATNVIREARFASGQKTLMLPGFDVPLGLIQVVTTGTAGTAYLDIEISPGRYKGVAALEV